MFLSNSHFCFSLFFFFFYTISVLLIFLSQPDYPQTDTAVKHNFLFRAVHSCESQLRTPRLGKTFLKCQEAKIKHNHAYSHNKMKRVQTVSSDLILPHLKFSHTDAVFVFNLSDTSCCVLLLVTTFTCWDSKS